MGYSAPNSSFIIPHSSFWTAMRLEFGIFQEFPCREGRADADAFAEGMALADAAEAWGLDAVWLAELHFTPGRSVLAAPLTLAAAIAARTERLKVGTAVQVL